MQILSSNTENVLFWTIKSANFSNIRQHILFVFMAIVYSGR